MPYENQFVLSYPAEVPLYYTRLSMREYSRPVPGAPTTLNLQTTIRLPLPMQLVDDYSMSVNQVNMRSLQYADMAVRDLADAYAAGQGITDTFSKVAGAAAGDIQGGFSVIQAMNLTAVQTAALVPGLSDLAPTVSAYLQSQGGIVRNPHLTSIFSGVNLRSFDFTWRLSAASQDEADSINSIIQYVKTYMHPKPTGNGFALEYPYLATVDFEVGGVNNSTLPRVRDSFITKLDVDNAPGGGISFYRDGNPVSILLRIGFQEVDILTRDDFTGPESS